MSRRGVGKGRVGNRKLALIILAGIVGAIVTISIVTYNERVRQENYVIAIQRVNAEAKQLTEHYNNEYARWNDKIIDDSTMVGIVDSIMVKQKRLIDIMKGMDVPDAFKEAHSYNLKSLEYEYDGYSYFKDYLLSKDENTLKRYQEMLQLAFENEVKALSIYNGKGLILP
jgi:hypothetical protein